MKNLFIIFILFVHVSVLNSQLFEETISVISNNCNPFLVDLDNDGDTDIVSTSGNMIVWHENLGGVFYNNKILIDSISRLHDIGDLKVVDINNDGDYDIIAVEKRNSGEIFWYKGLGQLNFSNKQTLLVLDNPTQIAISDIDNDGNKDILYTSTGWEETGEIFNNGNGTFTRQTYTYNTVANYILTVDLDNDGDDDMITAGGSFIQYRENLGGYYGLSNNILFNNSYDISSIKQADFDNDGNIDILATSKSNNTIVWYKNTGGSFSTGLIIDSNLNNAFDSYSVDMDNDGDIDVIAISNVDNKVVWYENLNLGVFSTANVISLGFEEPTKIITGDLNNDSLSEIIIQQFDSYYKKRLVYFENTTFNPFEFTGQKLSELENFATGDIDNDGDNDIIVVDYTNNMTNLVVIENLGGDRYREKIIDLNSYLTSSNNYNNYNNLIIADLDNDGFNDIIAAGYDFVDKKLFWYRNLGNGTFQKSVIINGNLSIESIAVGDIDNDNDNDIVINGLVLKNNGSNQFQSYTYTNYLFINGDLKLYDYNNDGYLDIVRFVSGSNGIVWYENIGGGNFDHSGRGILSFTVYHNSSLIKDMDNDGLDDFLCVVDYSKIYVYKNLGNGTYSPYLISDISSIVPSSSSVDMVDIDAVDIDNDLDLDILASITISSSFGCKSQASYYSNLGNLNFQKNDITTSICVDISLEVNDFDGDNNADMLIYTSKKELYYFKNQLFTSGIKTINDNAEFFLLYPNPTNGDITLSFNEQVNDGIITIYNVNGKEILNTSIKQTKSLVLNTSELKNGVYFIKLQNNNEVLTQKFIKQ